MKRLVLFLLLLSPSVVTAENLRIVTTLPVYASIARELIAGIDGAASSLIAPAVEVHSFEPRPSDILRLKTADLLIHTGLDLEPWTNTLTETLDRSDYKRGGAAILDLSSFVTILEKPDGVAPRSDGELHLHGNPHYWLSPENGRCIARAISERCILLRPQSRELISRNLESFEHVLYQFEDSLPSRIKPIEGKSIAVAHNEWIYLTSALHIKTQLYLESHPGLPPSPSQMKKLRSELSSHSVGAIVVESSHRQNDNASVLSTESGVPLVVLAQQTGELPGTEHYVDLLSTNVSRLLDAMGKP